MFKINTGPVAYVRRIDIVGNERTTDQVIRREFLQLERERYSREKVEKSRNRLRRLGYFEDVRIEIRPVSDNSEEVDLIVTIVEGSAGRSALARVIPATKECLSTALLTTQIFLDRETILKFPALGVKIQNH